MDRGGVTQDPLIEFPEGICDDIVVKGRGQFFLLTVDVGHVTDVAAPTNEETMDTPNSLALIGFPRIHSCPWNMP